MSRYYGRVGYTTQVEQPANSGIYVNTITERMYTGDTLRYKTVWKRGDTLNDDLDVSNQISVMADPFAYQNFSKIIYAEFMGELWKVTSVEVQRPRLILTLGGLYNG